MNWDDIGFLLYKNRYNENSLIAEIFTKNHGKVSGIIFGGTSKKVKNYLQIGNKIHINYNAKTENRIGYFKVEIIDAKSPYYFDDRQKLLIGGDLRIQIGTYASNFFSSLEDINLLAFLC